MYCGFSWLSYYNQSPDWVKALWVLSIPMFIAIMSALTLWFILSLKRLKLEAMQLDESGATLPSPGRSVPSRPERIPNEDGTAG